MGKLDEIIERLARMESIMEMQRRTCSEHACRLQQHDEILKGNGRIGLIEEVRSLKGKWTAAVAAVSAVVSLLFHLAPRLLGGR